MSQMPRCAVRYMGKSYPSQRGARCEKDHPHPGLRHQAITDGGPLSWWTDGEKEEVRKRKAEARERWPQSGSAREPLNLEDEQ